MEDQEFETENGNIYSVELKLERSIIPGRRKLSVKQRLRQIALEFDNLDEVVEFGRKIQELAESEKNK